MHFLHERQEALDIRMEKDLKTQTKLLTIQGFLARDYLFRESNRLRLVNTV